jgi:TniQ
MQQSLPILLYDERPLKPTFGYVFESSWVNPEESILSILWKFAYMNSIPGHAIVNQASIRLIDPYEGCEFSLETVDVSRMAQTLQLPYDVIETGLGNTAQKYSKSTHFRWCVLCLQRGYHSAIHQFECVRRCPAHQVFLESACRVCHEPMAYRLRADLLDSPFRCCQCGARFCINVQPLFRPSQSAAIAFQKFRRTRTLRLSGK